MEEYLHKMPLDTDQIGAEDSNSDLFTTMLNSILSNWQITIQIVGPVLKYKID